PQAGKCSDIGHRCADDERISSSDCFAAPGAQEAARSLTACPCVRRPGAASFASVGGSERMGDAATAATEPVVPASDMQLVRLCFRPGRQPADQRYPTAVPCERGTCMVRLRHCDSQRDGPVAGSRMARTRVPSEARGLTCGARAEYPISLNSKVL